MKKRNFILVLLLLALCVPSCKKSTSSGGLTPPPPPSMKKKKGPTLIKLNYDDAFFVGVVASEAPQGVPSGVCTATIHFPESAKGAKELRLQITFPCNSFPLELAGKRAVLSIIDDDEDPEIGTDGDSFTGVLKR